MTLAQRTVTIDCYPDSKPRYKAGWALVAVDVIRSMTTAVTAMVAGRSCYPVPSLEAAVPLAARLDNPLLVGELGGSMPYGFDLNNSPAVLARRRDTERPVILLSTTGTKLLCESGPCEAVYAACLRNYQAQIEWTLDRHACVAVVGAGTRGEFREEDQMCCAWIAQGLMDAGYEPQGQTVEIVSRWRSASYDAFLGGKSTTYLRRTDQLDDLEFILTHVGDVDAVFQLQEQRLVMNSVAAIGLPEQMRMRSNPRRGYSR
jgi:2-phosphosulfolactate phosphatase